jgi:hypothetical protein
VEAFQEAVYAYRTLEGKHDGRDQLGHGVDRWIILKHVSKKQRALVRL